VSGKDFEMKRAYYRGRLVDKITLEIHQTKDLSPEDMLDVMINFHKFLSSLRKDDCSWDKLKEIFLSLIRKLNEGKIRYAITGGFAVVMYGRPRTTIDVDIIVDISNFTELNKFLEIARSVGFVVSNYDFMLAFKERSRATGIHSEVPLFRLDVVFADELDRERLRRAKAYHVECTPVRLIRVEDLIPYLILYDRRDDALFLLKKYRKTIDLDLVKSLCKRLRIYERLKEFLQY